jgi:hypothetical protein
MKTIKSFTAALLLAVTALGAVPSPNADAVSILNVFAYQHVMENDDFLVIAKYRVNYAPIPNTVISDAYVGRLLKTGDVEIGSVLPVAYNDNGYGDGIFSFYLTATEVATNGLTWQAAGTRVVLGGIPIVTFTGDRPTVFTESIAYRNRTRTAANLTADILTLADQLEETWQLAGSSLSLVQNVSGNRTLSPVGEDYFTRSIPNLRVMAPETFTATEKGANFDKREFTQSYAEELQTFWNNTPIDDGFETIADLLKIPKLLVSTAILLMIMMAVAFYAGKLSGSQAFGLLTVAFTLPAGAVLGLTSLTFVMIVGVFSLLGIGYIFFYRSAA